MVNFSGRQGPFPRPFNSDQCGIMVYGRYVAWHVMSCHVVSCDVVPCRARSVRVLPCHAITVVPNKTPGGLFGVQVLGMVLVTFLDIRAHTICQPQSQTAAGRPAGQGSGLPTGSPIFVVSLRFPNDLVPKYHSNPKRTARFARQNCDIPKEYHRFSRKVVQGFTKNRRASRADVAK